MPWEFRKLTPAEFVKVANARIKDRTDKQEFMDALNAKTCQVIAYMMSNGKSSLKLADFMLNRPEIRKQSDDEMINGLIGFAAAIKDGVK